MEALSSFYVSEGLVHLGAGEDVPETIDEEEDEEPEECCC